MRTYEIQADAAGQRLDRYLRKLFPKAPPGLLQKSIRKKNIKVNDKKSSATTLLQAGDKVTVYFSDETINKFSNNTTEHLRETDPDLFPIIFENDHFLVVNKPVGILTQPDKSGDISVSDFIKNKIPGTTTFSPAPLNRLDRNTSGVIIAPKDYQTQKKAAELIRDRSSRKIYYALVKGKLDQEGSFTDQYSKDGQLNKAVLGKGEKKVSLDYKPIKVNNKYTLLEIDLKTGKSHQIRAQLAQHGYPIVGDPKYGDSFLNDDLKKRYGLKHQLLHAKEYALIDDQQELIRVEAELPDIFKNIIQGEF